MKRRVLLLDHPIGNLERCQNCGADCCRSFPAVDISWTEYDRLSALGANRLCFSLSGRYKLVIENGCEFLFQDRCSIYDQRPDICKRFLCLDDARDPKKHLFFQGLSPLFFGPNREGSRR